ncbi:MAG TPA: hypothetical protein VG838_13470 [Opitutaceae bacterium]|nr:hypothetical protein [Lacunisphaera sp.]HWA10450.1 hypothetical protein [Opitutaceae bacterium]
MAEIPCLICGHRADSKEHYIPQWLSKATGRPDEVIIKGSAAEGVVQSAQQHGTAIEAFEENLCRHCNNALGNALESPVSGLLKPAMAGDFSAATSLSDNQRQLIAWWAVVHALEHDFLENRLDPEPKRQLLGMLGALIEGKKPALPTEVHVHIAKSVHPEVVFFLSKQLIDRKRGSVHAPGSFCWGMQAGHLILTVSRLPSGARPAEGWGFGVWPKATAEVPTYDDIRLYYAASKIETGVPISSAKITE